jgi:asparagine N-glycosylation enzyme membrane subunit Stt3
MMIVLGFMPMRKLMKEKYTPFYGYYSSFLWLKNETNLKGTEINTGHIQPYAVMAPWDLGHHLKFYSNVPVISDNFGINVVHKEGLFDMAKFFLTEDEEDAIQILKKYRCKYIVVPFSSIYEQYPVLIGLPSDMYHEYQIMMVDGRKRVATLPKEKFYQTVGFRLSDIYGSANPSPDESMFAFSALKHFRLIHESEAAKSAGQDIQVGALKIYEYVRGKELFVPEEPDSFYKLEAIIVTNTYNRFFYRQYGYVKNRIVAPYPTVKIKDYPYAVSYKVYVKDKVYEFNLVREEDIK